MRAKTINHAINMTTEIISCGTIISIGIKQHVATRNGITLSKFYETRSNKTNQAIQVC
jgi:hypothetical protein